MLYPVPAFNVFFFFFFNATATTVIYTLSLHDALPISAHSIELDDTHEPSSSHPGTVIWTALLAAAGTAGAHRCPVTTAAVLDSAVAGYQVMASLGELLGPAELYRQGLHPTAVCGVFGATAAIGRLTGLDAGALGSAFGIALSLSAGSMA